MSYNNITRLSVGQTGATVKLDVTEGEHKLLAGSDFPSIITLRGNEPVVPQYHDLFNPANYGAQRATVTDMNGGIMEGFLAGPVSTYEKPILVRAINTTVYERWSSITYDSPLKPARIVVGKDETLTLIYNTNKITAHPVYKAYVKDGKLIRIEMMLTIQNETGVVLKFAPGAELVFKVSDPNAAPSGGVRDESVYKMSPAAASAQSVALVSTMAAPVKSGEMLTFVLDKASDIPVGSSTRALRIITGEEITAEKYLWYSLDNDSMIWGYHVQFRMALPRGRLYVIEQGTWDSIGMPSAQFPMIVPGKCARLSVAPINDRVRPVKKIKQNGGKTTVYEIAENGDKDIKTVYLLAPRHDQGRVTPVVPIVDQFYEFPADVGTVYVNEKESKDEQ